MRIFFDTEFIEVGHRIDLISIGMVREDGEEFYAESSECDLSKADDWVKENVIPHLMLYGSGKMTHSAMAKAIRKFVGPSPEFWANYAAYDWVALCQLFGTMMNLPDGWPKYCLDIRQRQWGLNMSEPPIPLPEDAHNALADARWNKAAFEYLDRLTGK